MTLTSNSLERRIALLSFFLFLFPPFSFSTHATSLLTSIRRLVGEIGAKYLPTARLERPRAVNPFSSSSSSSMLPLRPKPKKPPRPRPAAAPRRSLTAAAIAVSAKALVRLPPTLVTDGMARGREEMRESERKRKKVKMFFFFF